MRRILWIAVLLLLLTPVLAQNDDEEIPSHVIVISMDGVRPDGLRQAYTPNLDNLLENAAYSWEAETVLPSATIPAHASMLTGLDVDEHGVDHNNYSTELIAYPTFISLAADAGFSTAMIVGKEKFDQFNIHDETYYEFARVGDGSVIDVAIFRLDAGDRVLFLNLPNPDFFGHSTGWMSETYINELWSTDYQIGRLLDALDERGILETTLLIITSDHGGHDMEHGSAIPEDVLIPMIIAGYGVDAMELEGDINVTQVAATVLTALELPVPEDMTEPIVYHEE